MPRKGDNIRKRKDGRWEARYISDYGTDGKAIYKSIYGSKYADVKKEKSQRENQSLKATQNTAEITIEQATNKFLEAIRGKVKESTFAHYEFVCQKHILSYFKGQRIDRLNNMAIEKFISYKLKKGSLKGLPMSSKTVKDIVCVLFQIRKKYGNLHIDIEKPISNNQEITSLSEDEYNRLKNYVSIGMDNQKLGIIISLLTGIRLGELCALKWGDIDFANDVITINKTMQRIKDFNKNAIHKTKIIIDKPKTITSNREIPISSILKEKLQQLKYKNEYYVLTGTLKFIEPRSYQRQFKAYLKECGIKEVKFHVLRHTFATRAIIKGIDVKTLSLLLGHTDVSFTMKRYVHPDMEHKKVQIEKIAVGF